MKRYKFVFATDSATERFYTTYEDAATAAGGSMWFSLTFDEPGESPLIFIELPENQDPNTVAPLPNGAVWVEDEA